MKKVGPFFFTFVPLLLVMGIQLLATFFLMGVSALTESIRYAFSDSTSFFDFYNDLNILWSFSDFNTAVMIVYALITIAVFGLWYYIKFRGVYRPVYKVVFHPLCFVGILMLVPGIQYLCNYLVNFVASIFPQWLESYMKLLETAGLDDAISVTMLVYSIILAPVCEELVFRGVTMRQAEKIFPFWAANIFQALLFGVFHMNLIQGIYTFCVGLVLGFLCQKSGSIYHAILFHLLFNFWGTILSQYFYIGNSNFEFIFWFLFGLAMTVGGICIFTIGTHKEKRRAETHGAIH